MRDTLADRLDGLRVGRLTITTASVLRDQYIAVTDVDTIKNYYNINRILVKSDELLALARAIVAKADEAQDFSLTVTKCANPYTGNGVLVRVTHRPTGKYGELGFSGMGFGNVPPKPVMVRCDSYVSEKCDGVFCERHQQPHEWYGDSCNPSHCCIAGRAVHCVPVEAKA